MNIVPLANEGATYLILVYGLKPAAQAIAMQADEFRGWSYTDLAGRVADGQFSSVILKKFLKVRYAVDPVDAEDSGQRVGTPDFSH